jgi:tetratricopeptide (TPR) repeat protein
MLKKFPAVVPIIALLVLLTFSFPGRPVAGEKEGQIEQRLERGNELAQKGDLDGALTEYQKVLKEDEGNALAHNNLGIVYKRKGLYLSAVDEFKAALQNLPNYFKAYNNLGNVYFERGYYEEAVKYYHKCLAVKPSFADAHWNLALAYEEKGEKTRAIRHFKKFMDLSDASAYVALAQQHVDRLSVKPEEIELEPEITDYGEYAADEIE